MSERPQSKSGPKLTNEQRGALLVWLAADYSNDLILQWAADEGWPSISRAALSQHRAKYRAEIEALRTQRHADALNTGLALKEERVARLKRHADELEAIKWVPDMRGRLWNEKAWRETVDDIAKEMGGRAIKQEHSGSIQTTTSKVSIYIPDNGREDASKEVTPNALG